MAIVRAIARDPDKFSSLSESGFIPTMILNSLSKKWYPKVLISFREWLHSYVRV